MAPRVAVLSYKNNLIFFLCGYALAMRGIFDSFRFVVLFYLCSWCCGGDGSRQSAATSSVCPQKQPCVAAAVSSPPARWAIAIIHPRKIFSRGMYRKESIAVFGHWLCLPENLQLASWIVTCSYCVFLLRKPIHFSHNVSFIMIKINQRHVTWLHSNKHVDKTSENDKLHYTVFPPPSGTFRGQEMLTISWQ